MAPIRGRRAFRGRGRGRGGARNGHKRGYAAAKLEGPPEEKHPEHFNFLESDYEHEAISEGSSDEEDEAQTTSNAYQSLMRTYQSNTVQGKPPRKRLKTQHQPSLRQDSSENGVNDDSDNSEDGHAITVSHNPVLVQEVPVEDDESDEETNGEAADPFKQHFQEAIESDLSARLKAIAENRWTTRKLGVGSGRCLLQTPGEGESDGKRQKVTSIKDLKLKPRLVENAGRALGNLDEPESGIVPSMFEYQDILFGARTVRNAGRLRDFTCLHALNHIFKTRDRVIKNNAKVSAQTEGDEKEYRDQGFTRPKVLFLLETKQACVRVLDSITGLCDFEQQENKKRFLDSFSAPEDNFSDEKPEDFRELFEGNDENEFRIGLKFTRKTLKLYSKFYNSDIIFASALGLRRAIESGDSKKKDYDFLSSIEVVIMEQADATLMQNWEHAEYVFEHLNLQPKDAHGCDFSRVRSWYLDGHSANLRQTIVLSAYLTPKINTLYNKHMRNVAGRLKYTPDYTDGTIETLNYGIKQTFSRFESPSHTSDPDARFKYFSTGILPQISRLPKPPEGSLGVLVFIPSYLDFVRVRNSLVDSDFSYASISEYTDHTDVRKARSHFMTGRHSLLLYTGRAHHFHRYSIRGVKRAVFYGVPENPNFYEEVVGFIAKSVERGEIDRREASVRVAFSKWEKLELERVVGSKRVGKMVSDRGDTFDFI